MPKAKALFHMCAGVGVVLCLTLFGCSNPQGPTEADLARIESRFPALHETLEQCIVDGQVIRREWMRTALLRDTLLARGDTMGVRRLEREFRARVAGFRESQFARLKRPSKLDIFVSDSLHYLAMWARRKDSSWWYSAGYVYASRPPYTMPDGSGGGPILGRYKHLAGRWYLYSIERFPAYKSGD